MFNIFRLLLVLIALLNLEGKTINSNGNVKVTKRVLLPQLILVDPLEKVAPQQMPSAMTNTEMDVARGEVASFQLVLHAENMQVSQVKVNISDFSGDNGRNLKNVELGFIGYIKVRNTLTTPGRSYVQFNADFANQMYPDPILDTYKPTGFANTPIWVQIKIPMNTIPGIYTSIIKVTATISGKEVSLSQNLKVKVYPVTLPGSSLWVSNWWSNGPNVKKYFDNDADIIKLIARTMSEAGINSFLVNSLPLTSFTYQNGKYDFDFSRVGKIIKTFMDNGVGMRIEGSFLATRSGGSSQWNSLFKAYLPKMMNGKIVLQTAELKDPKVAEFYSQYLPAWIEYLKKNNYLNRFYQHIADEPIDANVASYNQMLSLVKKYAPGLKTIDAVQTDKISKQLDVIVPILDVLKKRYNSFRKMQQEGREVAFYTCWAPQGEYANRLIEMELIKTRYLPWLDFKYGLSGYLHWGFNQWSGNPLTEADKVAGDSWIVYPDPGKNKILPSIRLYAFRDGIADYQLLKMLAKKNKQLAMEITENSIASFTDYNTDLISFRKNRKQILSALSGD